MQLSLCDERVNRIECACATWQVLLFLGGRNPRAKDHCTCIYVYMYKIDDGGTKETDDFQA